MPTAAQFTPLFIESFVRRCHASGLTKEATVCLLEMSALKAAHEQQGFAAGFNERMSEGGLEKSAWAMAGKLMASGLGAAGLGYGAYRMGHNKARQPWPDLPSAGTFDPTTAATNERDQLAHFSRGIGDLNRQVGETGRRHAELQAVVDSNGPGAADAIRELQAIRRAPFARQRETYGRELDAYNQGVNRNLSLAERDLDNLNQSRGSFWNRTREFFGYPKDFDTPERELVGQKSRLAEQARLSERLRSRLRSGATGFDDRAPVPQEDLQSRFFPTR